MSWISHIVADIHDEDYNGICRPSAILRYLQIAANGQLHGEGPSNEKMRAMGKAFVLTAIDVTLNRPVRTYEELDSESCGCVGRGFLFPRYYALHGKDGTVAVGLGQFGLIDIETKTLQRYEDYPARFKPMPLPAYRMKRFPLPHTDLMERVGTYTVTYGQTDQNRHLNNTFYPDLFAGFLDMTGKWISHFSIRFQKEAPLGETLTVFRTVLSDGSYGFRTLRADGEINAEASLTVADL